ncbi:hypothetical protein FQA39_LY13963 [Lamprigera yunnana]|nr:hypothetical protein FQA39_LY13963 [Lamprigera yunnana]
MHRYLLNLSYLGTPFRGVQKQASAKGGRIDDLLTVQGQVEMGLKMLEPLNEAAVVISSRTDAGVHAIQTTMHTDLQGKKDKPYKPSSITECLNNFFFKNQVPIRILKTYLVPSDFHCRHRAISRTYLYRIIVIKNCKDLRLQHLPIEEYSRCLFLNGDEFNVNKAHEAAKLFVGYHDFRTFMHKSSFAPIHKITRKVIERCEIYESTSRWSNTYAWPFCVSYDEANYKAYDVVIKGKGFLYKQVR